MSAFNGMTLTTRERANRHTLRRPQRDFSAADF